MKSSDALVIFMILFLAGVCLYFGCEIGKQIGATAQKNGNIVWTTNSTTIVTFKIKE